MAAIDSKYRQHLGQDLYLFDSTFNGNAYVHVRKLVNQNIPTKDGISLTLQRCNELFMSLPFLEDALIRIEQNGDTFYTRHLGGNWHVTVQSGFNRVDIRKFWFSEGATELRATRKGVSLTFEQFRELKNGLRMLDSFVPELSHIVPCYSIPYHDVSSCAECTPK